MKQLFYKGRFIFIPIAVAGFLSIISYVVMQLWNCLLPDVLHVTTITFWQAMGIFILCKILFGFGKGGGWRGGRGGGAPWMRHKMEERFKSMTPEQKEKFKQKMRDRANCGPWGRGGHFDRDWDQFDAEAPKAPQD
jgi:hypothetical protein